MNSHYVEVPLQIPIIIIIIIYIVYYIINLHSSTFKYVDKSR